MWPKALAQFIELAPHIGRLLPLADRFLQSKAIQDDAARAAAGQITTATDGLRGDLDQVASSNAALARLVGEQAERTAILTSDLRAVRDTAERLQAEIKPSADALARAEARLARLHILLLANLAGSFILLLLVVILLLRLK